MTHKYVGPAEGRHSSASSQREQALCVEALESGEFDNLSDAEWVALCERISREEEESASLAVK